MKRRHGKAGGFMPGASLDDFTATAQAGYPPMRAETNEVAPPTMEHVTMSTHRQIDHHSARNSSILSTGGTTTGAAILGGILAGPIGAIVGTVAGLGLGLFLQRSQRT